MYIYYVCVRVSVTSLTIEEIIFLFGFGGFFVNRSECSNSKLIREESKAHEMFRLS